jgi:hypothetical protein
VNFSLIPPGVAKIIALGFNWIRFGVSAHVDTSKLANMLARAIFTAMSPNSFPEIDEVYLKYGVFTMVKIHITVFWVMTTCCSLY